MDNGQRDKNFHFMLAYITGVFHSVLSRVLIQDGSR